VYGPLSWADLPGPVLVPPVFAPALVWAGHLRRQRPRPWQIQPHERWHQPAKTGPDTVGPVPLALTTLPAESMAHGLVPLALPTAAWPAQSIVGCQSCPQAAQAPCTHRSVTLGTARKHCVYSNCGSSKSRRASPLDGSSRAISLVEAGVRAALAPGPVPPMPAASAPRPLPAAPAGPVPPKPAASPPGQAQPAPGWFEVRGEATRRALRPHRRGEDVAGDGAS
jgi:hypothetical protein